MSFRLWNRSQTPIKALGLGVFDGFHRGHASLYKACTHLLTFYPHPDHILNKNPQPYLTTLKELKTWMPQVIALHFTKTIAEWQPETFLDRVIHKHLNPDILVVGYDFKFGANRKGNLSILTQWASAHQKEVIVIPEQQIIIDQKPMALKSSKIRHWLLSGDFQTAIKALGHPYLMIGKVITGEKRGRTLGFPTANLHLPKFKLIPKNGVYGGKAWVNQTWKDSLIYIGNKPTFGTFKQGVEVFITDGHYDLYHQPLKILLETKIRDELKFSSSDALVKQLHKDLASLKK